MPGQGRALDRGNAQEAVSHYQDALRGPFASDPELQFGLASALLCQESAVTAERACEVVAQLRSTRPDYRKDEVALFAARALAGAGRTGDAAQAFEHALKTYNNVEIRARYIAWLAAQGDAERAAHQLEDLRSAARHWSSHARSINREALAAGSAYAELALKRADPAVLRRTTVAVRLDASGARDAAPRQLASFPQGYRLCARATTPLNGGIMELWAPA